MFNANVTLESLNQMSSKTMVQHLGIEFVEIGNDYLKASMPVDTRTHQPFGVLHGGASVALAETLGSVAANAVLTSPDQYCVGQEINANHIRSVREGLVYGVTRPIHIGKTSQVWETRISDERNRLVCISRITLAVLNKNK